MSQPSLLQLKTQARAFVIGATGTIGQATVRALLRRGYEVVCFVRLRSGLKGKLLLMNNHELFPGAIVRFGDVTNAASLANDGFCGDLLSFHVFFQCKRYDGQVSAGAMRDFRGAMVGRGDKGLLITTGGFTRDAVKEATRDGTPPIELVDGDALCSLLKAPKMGVTTELVERTTVDVKWFKLI